MKKPPTLKKLAAALDRAERRLEKRRRIYWQRYARQTAALLLLAGLLTGCTTPHAARSTPPMPPGAGSGVATPKLVSFTWDANNPATPDYSYWLISTTNLPLPQASWLWMTNVPSTNASVWVTPQAMFFGCVASNSFWGLVSDTSNVIAAPAPANPVDTIKITVTK